MADDAELTSAPPDEYERRYMDGDAAILRARQRMPRWSHALLLAILTLGLAAGAPGLYQLWSSRADPWAWTAFVFFAALFASGGAVTTVMALADHCLRVALTPTHLHVHRGLVTEAIPLAAVTSVAAEDARERRGGPTLVGALSRREAIFAMPGAARQLRVAWRDARGRARTTWVQFDEAPTFARRIGALLAGTTGVRVTAGGEAEEAPAARDDAQRGVKRGVRGA